MYTVVVDLAVAVVVVAVMAPGRPVLWSVAVGPSAAGKYPPKHRVAFPSCYYFSWNCYQ